MKNVGTWGTSGEERRRQAWVRTSESSQKQCEGFEDLEDRGQGCEESQ